MKNDIVITQWENSDVNALHPNTVKNDNKLSSAISDYYDRTLLPLGVKKLEQRYNVIITDVCIYGAFYEKDLKHVNN